MTKRITKIALRHFRGATVPTEIQFDPAKPVVMIFGENGSGKSTLIDAIDMACNQAFGSLGERSSVRPKEHLPALGRKARDVEVAVTLAGSTVRASLGSRPVVSDRPLDLPAVHVLRRSQMLRLIEATPAKRYEELSRFIDVAGVERSEAALKSAMDSANRRLDGLAAQISRAEADLQKLWIEEGRPESTAEEWAKTRSQIDETNSIALLGKYNTLLEALNSAEAACSQRDETERERDRREVALQEIEQQCEQIEESAEAGSIQMVTVLTETQTYFEMAPDTEACPVCRTQWPAGEILSQIQRRLDEMKQIRQLTKALQEAQRERQRAEDIRRHAAEAAGVSIRSLTAALRAMDLPGVHRLPELQDVALDQYTDSEQNRTKARSLIAHLNRFRATLIERRNGLERQVSQRNLIRQFYTNLHEGRAEMREADRLQRHLREMFETVRSTRHEYTTSILSEVSDACNRFYAWIHPDEPLGQMELTLNDKTRASLLQHATFAGHAEVPPQAYYSEGHLDTLGFCLFLALADRSGPDGAIVVLDDVFTSLDAEHLDRIARLLAECADEGRFAQIIITTHSRTWFEHFSRNTSVQRLCDRKKLMPWSLERGIRDHASRLVIDELRGLLEAEPMDRQAVASKAGVFLESVLDALTIQYACSMPRNARNLYELSALCDGMAKQFRTLRVEREGEPPITFEGWHERLKARIPVRNAVGAHYNLHGADVSDGDVRAFATAAIQLLEALTCPNCGEVPSRDAKTHLECRCKPPTRLSPPPGR